MRFVIRRSRNNNRRSNRATLFRFTPRSRRVLVNVTFGNSAFLIAAAVAIDFYFFFLRPTERTGRVRVAFMPDGSWYPRPNSIEINGRCTRLFRASQLARDANTNILVSSTRTSRPYTCARVFAWSVGVNSLSGGGVFLSFAAKIITPSLSRLFRSVNFRLLVRGCSSSSRGIASDHLSRDPAFGK